MGEMKRTDLANILKVVWLALAFLMMVSAIVSLDLGFYNETLFFIVFFGTGSLLLCVVWYLER